MNKAYLYQKSNSLQRRDAKEILKEFGHLIQWRGDGEDSILDIGCGSGDVLIDYLLPVLPQNYSRVIGADISEQMVRYARDTYGYLKGISFATMDIGALAMTSEIEPVHHITSFYCLHWVQNQKAAVQNIYNLLTPDGDCLLTFLANMPIFEIYEKMARSKRWASYMTDVHKFVSPYQHSKKPAEEFWNLMYAAGFTEIRIELKDNFFVYDGIDILKKSVRAINPFLERIPAAMHESFLNDYVGWVARMSLFESNNKIITPYKLLVAYGKK
ncbi:juvenile hormone acid O-methyltransferase [Phlebotomus argentipes]|uniref:juvenile hormone acid O-methyltransferase n=1 Tax=Phlebotomus argentipes TaxID=94469 RepID=UPI0028938361|nr:juvenile hormone acid O-methyltransferase [Phlebotomus argentipes]